MTTLIPILSTVLLDDFSKASRFRGQGPKTFQERLFLIAVYIPYFLIPLILLLFMVRNPYYKSEEKRKKRGFNHSELLARQISDEFNIPYCDSLYKVRDNIAQHSLNLSKRKLNVKCFWLFL